MPAIAGKKARFRVATTVGGTYNVILGGVTGNHEMSAANLDVSEFGVDYMQRIQGLKDGRLTLSGNYRPDDTNGQLVIRAAFLNDTTIFLKALPDDAVTTGAGLQQEMKVSSWKVDASVADKVSWSVDLEGTGAITIV